MRHLLANEYASMPWKNGRGETREIAKSSSKNGLIWRLSLASITQDGPFSNFPDLSRILIVTIGEGMRLIDTYTGAKMLAPLYTPLLFSGDQPIEGQLIDGPTQNFNIIYDPTRIKSTLCMIEGPEGKKLSPQNGEIQSIHCLSGTIKLNQTFLNQDETALLMSPDVIMFSCPESTKALLVTFTVLS